MHDIENYLDLADKIKKLQKKQSKFKPAFDSLTAGKFHIGKYTIVVKSEKYDTTDTKKVLKTYPELRAIVKTVKRKKVSYVKTK